MFLTQNELFHMEQKTVFEYGGYMDREYRNIFLEPIKVCASYKPKLGTSEHSGIALNDFMKIYSADPFYSWIGLDSPLMYSAHKAAGGMTSIYRQIGVGCERLFRQIILDCAKYDDESFASWSYMAKTKAGVDKKLSLDGRLEFSEIKNSELKHRIKKWASEYSTLIGAKRPSEGVVFEVRQGYKSKDSKRQNADIDNATVAWSQGYLPIFAIFSSQIDNDIVIRYTNNRCGILFGVDTENNYSSLFAFFRDVIGYDLAGFFKRNSDYIRVEIDKVLGDLLG